LGVPTRGHPGPRKWNPGASSHPLYHCDEDPGDSCFGRFRKGKVRNCPRAFLAREFRLRPTPSHHDIRLVSTGVTIPSGITRPPHASRKMALRSFDVPRPGPLVLLMARALLRIENRFGPARRTTPSSGFSFLLSSPKSAVSFPSIRSLGGSSHRPGVPSWHFHFLNRPVNMTPPDLCHAGRHI